jgi:hypothetical protein
MEVPGRTPEPGNDRRMRFATIQELFGAKICIPGAPAAQFKEGHARVGLKPEDEPDGHSSR